MDNATQQPADELMRYFDKEMSEDERAAFEAELSNNELLQQELSSLETARKAIVIYGIREQVSAIHQSWKLEDQQVPVIKMSSYKRIIQYSVAAAACLLLAWFGINQFSKPADTADSLYAAAYVNFEPSANRGTNEAMSDLEKAFTGKKYDEVIGLYNINPTIEPKQMILAGVAYLEIGNSTVAIETFRSLISNNRAANSTAYNDDAQYYLALSLLKARQYPAAVVLMQQIHADSGNAYSSKFSEAFISRVKNLK